MSDELTPTTPFVEPVNRVETGLAPVPPAPPARVNLPDGWNIAKVGELVNELAQRMYDEQTILSRFKLSQAQYDTLAKNEFFQKALEAATEDWNRPGSTNRRLALESALAIERALPDVVARCTNKNEPLPGIVQLLKLLAEISGTVGNAKATDAPREKFKIIINLGADQQVFDKERPLVQVNTGESGDSASVQSLLEAPGVPAAIQANLGRSGD